MYIDLDFEDLAELSSTDRRLREARGFSPSTLLIDGYLETRIAFFIRVPKAHQLIDRHDTQPPQEPTGNPLPANLRQELQPHPPSPCIRRCMNPAIGMSPGRP